MAEWRQRNGFEMGGKFDLDIRIEAAKGIRAFWARVPHGEDLHPVEGLVAMDVESGGYHLVFLVDLIDLRVPILDQNVRKSKVGRVEVWAASTDELLQLGGALGVAGDRAGGGPAQEVAEVVRELVREALPADGRHMQVLKVVAIWC